MGKKIPRAAATYRAARRNKVLREDKGVWVGIKANVIHAPVVRANKRDPDKVPKSNIPRMGWFIPPRITRMMKHGRGR